MVKFGDNIEHDERLLKWRDYCVNYSRLKGWISEAETSRSSAAAQQFFDELTISLERVEGFYCAKEDALIAQSEALSFDTAASDPAVIAIKEDAAELCYYAMMNREGLRKIAKKFDKQVSDKRCQSQKDVQVSDTQRTPTNGQKKGTWGFMFEALQPRLVARFPQFRFAMAESRLDKITESLPGEKLQFEDEANYRQISGDSIGPQATVLDELKKPLQRRNSLLNVVVEQEEAKRWAVAKEYWKAFGSTCLCFFAESIIVLLWFYSGMYPKALDSESFIVIWVTVITLTLLVWQWSSDCVMIGATLVLALLGMIETDEAWEAFSNDVVLSVAALSVVGDAVSHTGFVDILFEKIIGQPQSLIVAMLRMFIPCALGAASISNTAVMACCMPAIKEWSAKSGKHIALFFMPISYIMLIAGTFAIFSTSTNLVAQGLLVANDLPQLSTFGLAMPALVMTVVSLFYLVIMTPIVLNRFLLDPNEEGRESENEIKAAVKAASRAFKARIQVHSREPQTVEQSGLLGLLSGGIDSIVSVERYGVMLPEKPTSDFEIHFDDILNLSVTAGCLQLLGTSEVSSPHFFLLGLGATQLYATTHKETREYVEVVLDSNSAMVGQKIATSDTYKLYAGAVIGIRKRGSTTDIYKLGDQVVLEVAAGFAKRFSNAPDFLVCRKVGMERNQDIDRAKAYTSGAVLAIMLVFVAFSIFPLFACALAAIFAMACTGCATPNDLKKAIPMKVVLTIVGAFGLGKAIGKHGVAEALGEALVFMCGPFGHIGLLTAVAVATVLLGIIFHGTAVVALMFPLCVQVASTSGIPLHQMIAVLCYSVACQMLSPVSYNTNLMAYAACPEYDFVDFPKLGGPLVLIILVLSIPLCQWWFPE